METVILIIGVVNAVLLILILMRGSKVNIDTGSIVSSVKDGLGESQKQLREEVSGSVQSSVRSMSESLTTVQRTIGESQAERLYQADKRIAQMQGDMSAKLESIRRVVDERLQTTLDEKMVSFGTMISDTQKQAGQSQKLQIETMDKKLSENLTAMGKSVADRQEQSGRAVQEKLEMLEKRFQTLESSNNERLDGMKRTMSEHLDRLSETNQKKLDGIQSMVSEKLESNLRESFKVVSERLEQVHKSLGEMQNIAAGVGDLKKVLSNVKTRGIMGEIQLGMILDEILAPDQYEKEVPTIPGSTNRVEFAVRLPGADGEGIVYLPIDSKFPGDTYRNLQDAYETGDHDRIAAAKKALEIVVRKCASDIRSKYVEPPYTTNFGVMFLPFEGLYAEVVNSGMVDVLQREYSVTITGPSTMAAMLNSLQMGFRTLAIQKRSNEVWQILGETKSEFGKFEKALDGVQNKITKAGEELEKLVGTRTRAINRKLRSVEAIDYEGTPALTADDEE